MKNDKDSPVNGRVMAIFDWDGTLVDSVDNLYLWVCEVFKQSRIVPPSLIEYAEGLSSPYTEFYKRYGVTASEEQIWEWYRSAPGIKPTELFWDTVETLKILHLMEVQIAIVSGQRTESIIEHPGFQSISKFLVSVSGYQENKVDAIFSAFDVRQINRWRVLYIGDFCSDMRDAFQAHVIPVGITRGLATKGCLIDAGATFCIEQLQELIPIVDMMRPSRNGPPGD